MSADSVKNLTPHMNKERFTKEWLQTNRSGTFSMGCVDRVPRRKYHTLLTIREPGFGDPLNVLTEVCETISFGQKSLSLHAISYGSQIYPHGFELLTNFSHHPAPSWEYQIDTLHISRTIDLDPDDDVLRINYKLTGVKEPVSFLIEPLIASRPIHQLTKENPFLNGLVRLEKEGISIEPYTPLPRFYAKITGKHAVFNQSGRWNKRIYYSIEHERGYDDTEDNFCPGDFKVSVKEDCSFTFHFGPNDLQKSKPTTVRPGKIPDFETSLKKAGEQFVVKKKNGNHSIIAGYPWFDEWARDSMIAMRGLLFSTKKITIAKEILENYGNVLMKTPIQFAPTLVGGTQNLMLDAPFLFVRAVQNLEEVAGKNAIKPLMPIVYHVLDKLHDGLDSRIKITPDGGLLTQPGNYAATWMDAAVNGSPVSPRHGYAIELNALLYNSILFALEWAKEHNHSGFIEKWTPIATAAGDMFKKRFWSEELGYLADVHDGTKGIFTIRPNQLWAVALPFSPLTKIQAEKVVNKVKADLLTPYGLRTLAPSDPQYHGKYRGTQRERDESYHQGAVWPWLLGLYVDACLKVQTLKKTEAELSPILSRLEQHMNEDGCLGQISELFDGEQPHAPGGAPAQAWSVSELLRIISIFDAGRTERAKK